jgi:hypothetical protein
MFHSMEGLEFGHVGPAPFIVLHFQFQEWEEAGGRAGECAVNRPSACLSECLKYNKDTNLQLCGWTQKNVRSDAQFQCVWTQIKRAMGIPCNRLHQTSGPKILRKV